MCLCARFARTPRILAGMCGVKSVASGFDFHPVNTGWVGGLCVCVCARPLYPAIPGSGVRCGCACLGLGFGCAPPLLAGCVGLCVLVCTLSLYPLFLVGDCGLCAWVGVLGFTPPIQAGLLECVCLWARFAPTPPVLADLCRVGASVRVLLSARQSWHGFSGVCVFVRAPPVPRQSWTGCAVWMCLLWFEFWLRPTISG